MITGEVRHDLAAILGHNDLLFDPRSAGAIRRTAPGFQGKNHVFLDHRWVIQTEAP